MKMYSALLIALSFCSSAMAATSAESPTLHRYLVERTFPKGAIDAVTTEKKAVINQTNSQFGVNWVMSFLNPDKTKTYCVYEGPDEKSIRDAAAATGMSVDAIHEIPETLESH